MTPLTETIYSTHWPIEVTLWLLNIVMEHGPFIEDFPMKSMKFVGFPSQARLITEV